MVVDLTQQNYSKICNPAIIYGNLIVDAAQVTIQPKKLCVARSWCICGAATKWQVSDLNNSAVISFWLNSYPRNEEVIQPKKFGNYRAVVPIEAVSKVWNIDFITQGRKA